MPLIRFPTVKGLVYTIDLSKITDRENPRTVEAPFSSNSNYPEPITIDWGDGTADTLTSGVYPTHTYAQGAGDKFTVVIRSAGGRIPIFRFKKSSNDVAEKNVEIACISIDHFAGWEGSLTAQINHYAAFRSCLNLEYIDPRVVVPNSTSYGYFFRNTKLTQSVRSFCFDFATGCTSLTQLFGNCSGLSESIPSDFFDNVTLNTTFAGTFQSCSGLTGDGYVFWKADGSLDTDKFPLLDSAGSCYSGCTGIDRSKIPTAYGGTMTVS